MCNETFESNVLGKQNAEHARGVIGRIADIDYQNSLAKKNNCSIHVIVY